ncbi:MAG: DUF4340 domain-containing protein [Sedimenticola sp.]|nr:DUF4340 domain-containing protein [Sedimenticola sp.]
MRRQSLINLFLLLIVLLLGLFVWLTPEEREQPTVIPLTALQPSAIKHIEIRNNNGPAFVLQRNADSWQMTAPYPIAANGPRIDILMDLLSTPQVETFPLPADRLAEFGLDKPLAEVTFNDTLIIFGGTHPYNYRRYVRIDDQLYLINDIFPHHVLAQAEAFISHALLPANVQINQITTPDWQIKADNTQWRLTPLADTVSQEQLQRKIDTWLHTWVSKVTKPPDVERTGSVTITLKQDPTPLTFGIVKQQKQTLLIQESLGLAYHLNSDSLLQPPGESH